MQQKISAHAPVKQLFSTPKLLNWYLGYGKNILVSQGRLYDVHDQNFIFHEYSDMLSMTDPDGFIEIQEALSCFYYLHRLLI